MQQFGNAGLLDVFERIVVKYQHINRYLLVTSVIPELMMCIENTPFILKDNTFDGELLIVQKDKGYAITNNYNVLTIGDEYVMGSGSYVAFGSLYTTRYMDMDTERRIELAILAAGAKCVSVSSEVYIGNSNGKGFSRYIPTMKIEKN